MGPLRLVYNVASNKPPQYRDSVDVEDPDALTSDSGQVDGSSDLGEAYTSPFEDRLKTSLLSPLTRRIPAPLKRAATAVVQWAKGPVPPRPWSIKPLFPAIQTAPLRLLDRYAPQRKHRFWLLIALYFCWILAFSLVLHKSAFTAEVPGYGAPVRLSCGTSLWYSKNGCGMNGNQCRPFTNDTFAFRCPANCIKTQVLEPHAVGDQEIVYKSLVIGGPKDGYNDLNSTIYRGDSFICGAAIHAGFFRNNEGGCGVVSIVGESTDYPSVRQHGIDSIGFDSNFPRSFKFLAGTKGECKDLRWPLLAVSVFCTTVLSLFTTSPAVFLGSIFVALFFHVGLASDPPNLADYYALISLSLGRFLPAAFVMYAIYRYCVLPTLRGLEAQVEKTILWLGSCWVGALNNYTFDKIPIQRLTAHDLHAQPGAIPALLIVVFSIFGIALGQAWAIRIEGNMPVYLAVYGGFVICILMLVAVPNMNLRIHHYILALLLVPGTAMQNRPSLLYQGLLIGLFINGIARWGFDSILQTPGELFSNAPSGSSLPNITNPVIGLNNITFNWGKLPDQYDGISILVNDVERFRGYEDYQDNSFTWTRRSNGHPEYFRFGYMDGSTSADFSRAGIWNANDTWTDMQPGPS